MKAVSRTSHKGLWIAVFGPDGVGKSAVIDEVERQLAPVFAGVSRFHFRPRFRGTCEAGPVVTKPHGKPARGTAVSLFKLIYWLADCWWGYLTAILPQRSQGKMIVFDRYVPDILVDPVRYRIPAASMRFIPALLKFAPQPDLYVLLDGSAEVIQGRKRELSLKEYRRQRIAYLKMFENLQCKLLVNADSSLDEVSRCVAVGVCSLQSEFFSQPRDRSFAANL